jgi:hypothetical protein
MGAALLETKLLLTFLIVFAFFAVVPIFYISKVEKPLATAIEAICLPLCLIPLLSCCYLGIGDIVSVGKSK